MPTKIKSSLFKIFFILLFSFNPLNAVELANDTFDTGLDGWSGSGLTVGSNNNVYIAGDTTATKTYSFGSMFANATLSIELEMTPIGGWEVPPSTNADSFNVLNGTTNVQSFTTLVDDSTVTKTVSASADANGDITLNLNPNVTDTVGEFIKIWRVTITGDPTSVDGCNSDFSGIVSSSQNYTNASTLKNKNSLESYYIQALEAGTVTITMSSTKLNDAFFIYDETGCPSGNSGGKTTGSYTFTEATDFNLLIYTPNNQGTDYTIDISFLSANNSAPIANPKNYATGYETELTGNINTDPIVNSDPNGDPITISSFTQPTNGTLSILADGGNGDFKYTPNVGYSGLDTFTYSITDGSEVSITETVTILVYTQDGAPEYDEEYSCGIFPSVLASYSTLVAQQNDVYNTCKVSVKDYDLIDSGMTCFDGLPDTNPELCECDPAISQCSSNETCEIIPEPTNRYSHSFIDTPLTETVSHSGDIVFTELYNPSYNLTGNKSTVHFNPQYSYSGSSKKVSVFGDVSITGNGEVITFEPGDYYFNSLTLDNNPEINIQGAVRLFIKNDFIYSGNNMDTVNDGSLFLYVGGDLSFTSNGGGRGFIDMFVYVLGTATINANANATSLFGGISSESGILINGKNINFIYNELGADAMGYGECKMCYALKDTGSFVKSTETDFTFPRDTGLINIGKETLKDINVTQTETTIGMSINSNDHYIVDENGNHESFGVTSSCTSASGNTCNGTTELKTYFDELEPGSTSLNKYYAIRSEAADIATITLSDFRIDAIFYIDDKLYDIEVDYCDTEPIAPTDPVIGIYDAWDNPSVDKNITTKVANQPFELEIVSLDEFGLEQAKPVNAEFQLYDDNTSRGISGNWLPFTSTQKTRITQAFTINNAYRDVHVQFRFCTDANSTFADLQNCEDGLAGYNYSFSRSRDSFAIRPDRFILSTQSPDDIELLTSAKVYNLSLRANQFSNTNITPLYTINNAQNVLTTSKIIYDRDGNDQTNFLNGDLNISKNNSYEIINGLSDEVGVYFTDVGLVNMQVIDSTWAAVDIGQDTTPVDCSANGAYVCGSVDGTFIPSHFVLSSSLLRNKDDSSFTYLSDDLNISAGMDLTISAKNTIDGTTKNFTAGFWENPVSVTLTLPVLSAKTPIVNDISTANIGFIDGNKTIEYNSTIDSQNLIFNFDRTVFNAKNPFVVNGSDITSALSTTYTSSSGNSQTLTKAIAGNGNATFIYGRTNAPRKVFLGNTGVVPIYYESYCSSTPDDSNVVCDKALLPNGTGSKTSDDPRWYINTLHSTTTSGDIGVVSQKIGTAVTPGATTINAAGETRVSLTYTGTNYPYKATMQNRPALWLVYDKYDLTEADDTNEFQVEFIKDSSAWAGQHETNSSTNMKASEKTNRRSMW